LLLLKPGSKSLKKFDEIYGTPDCHHSRDRPKTKREIANGLKPQYKLSNKDRGLMKCSQCHKQRVVWALQKLDIDEKSKLRDINQTIHFTCGEILVPDDKKYDSLRAKKVCVDRRRTCDTPLEKAAFDLILKQKKINVCLACCQEVPPEVVTKLRGLQKQYSTVLPNCGDKKCMESMFGYERGKHPGWICQRPKKKSLQEQREHRENRKRRYDDAMQNMRKKKKLKKKK